MITFMLYKTFFLAVQVLDAAYSSIIWLSVFSLLLKNAWLFQPKFGSNMDKPKCWVKNVIKGGLIAISHFSF